MKGTQADPKSQGSKGQAKRQGGCYIPSEKALRLQGLVLRGIAIQDFRFVLGLVPETSLQVDDGVREWSGEFHHRLKALMSSHSPKTTIGENRDYFTAATTVNAQIACFFLS